MSRVDSLRKTRKYLYDKLTSLNSDGYKLSSSISNQIKLLSNYRYKHATRGDVNDFFLLLEDADFVDSRYDIKGCPIWLPYGVSYVRNFVDIFSQDLVDSQYSEYIFPNLISANNFDILCSEIYDFKDQVISAPVGETRAILKPTGETAIYPTIARWLREGKSLPMRIFQTGPYFRYKSSPNIYFTPIECSFMLEAHGIFHLERS